jgi:hypothetical protein
MSRRECTNCKSKKYGYKDNNGGKFYICYNCGSFDGKTTAELMEKLLYEPTYLLVMIQTGELMKID